MSPLSPDCAHGPHGGVQAAFLVTYSCSHTVPPPHRHTHTCTHAHTGAHTCSHICTHMLTYAHTLPQVHTCTHSYAHTCMRSDAHTEAPADSALYWPLLSFLWKVAITPAKTQDGSLEIPDAQVWEDRSLLSRGGGCDLAKVTQQASSGALVPDPDSSSFQLPRPCQSPEAGPSGAVEPGVLYSHPPHTHRCTDPQEGRRTMGEESSDQRVPKTGLLCADGMGCREGRGLDFTETPKCQEH